MEIIFFSYYVYLTSHYYQFLYTGCFSRTLYPDIIKSDEIESENKQYHFVWFSMGIYHSNPYIHSTTVLYWSYIASLIYKLVSLQPHSFTGYTGIWGGAFIRVHYTVYDFIHSLI